MESLIVTSSPDITKLLSSSSSPSFSANGHSSFFLYFPHNKNYPSSSLKLRTSVVTSASNKDKKNKKKSDSHSFVPKPDEATGPFPEALLLRERKVQEDGRLLPEFADAEEGKPLFEELFEALNLQLESDLNVDQMRHYEVVYLIHEDHADEVESVNAKVQEFLKEKKGKLWRFSDWGMRRLAYKIQKASRAHYILMNFEVGAKWINDFKSMLDKDERVIRHLVMKQDKAETEDCPPPPEFHTVVAGTDDENEEDLDDDDYDEDDLEDDIEMEMNDDGVILVDADDDVDDRNSRKSNTHKTGKRKVSV
ncbi:protein REGULATOR OF FATTY ACID COMPOSITION 3, chloroplastic isoform X1 [Lycium ferocissimum]|uniref:protein REGULATOR OF FATTY ACID COMPOSITION 3, chloroplastic isoform X1 n=1 Tax=Lycium ferocissimum TaxID=112874 RepID=UPI002814FFD2|nr:protein REGULATOR OF FATTY ACID COMPOSITION 3, chloroplastic isoform X1 [Lycium ferocissimum]